MGSLTIVLFLLGVVFLFLGWRWQSPPSEEAVTALKGLAYFKKELLNVQEQVRIHILEEKTKKTNKFKSMETEGKSKPYMIKAEDPSEINGRDEEIRHQCQDNISPKYQEVLELAAQGLRIPEIAQRTMISQDAVRMVLQTQHKGGFR